jgi:alcohol dehydrogenase class IV
MQYISDSLLSVATTEQNSIKKRTSMAYAAMVSGVTLANAGLGIIHGIAGPVGGFYSIPHGLVCGALLYEALKESVEYMKRDEKRYACYLNKCAIAGSLISKKTFDGPIAGCDALLETVKEWGHRLNIPKLGAYGITKDDVLKIVDVSSNKNNPVKLEKAAIQRIIEKSL